jgi:hypothetical protein
MVPAAFALRELYDYVIPRFEYDPRGIVDLTRLVAREVFPLDSDGCTLQYSLLEPNLHVPFGSLEPEIAVD